MVRLDRFFDVYERVIPAWTGDALAAVAVVSVLLMAVF
jgi:hypothetical protein